MANTLLTISMITNEALFVLKNQLGFTRFINRQYDDRFGVEGAKIGYTLNVRKPARYTVTKGTGLAVQDITETYVPVTLTTQGQVAMNFTSADLLLSIDEFRERIIEPAVAALANQIDADGLALWTQIYNQVGVPGTTPNTLLTYLNAGALLDNNSVPRGSQRAMVISAQMQATIVDALKGLFQASEKIAEQYDSGEMGIVGGFKWTMDQNVASQTVGPQGGAPVVNGAAQVGASLVTNTWTAAAAARMNAGDLFTLPGVYGVNPQSRQSTGALQQFVVTQNVNSDGGGNATLPISPAITTAGQFQTVTASPANAAALTLIGAANTVSPQGMAFHRDFATLVTADLPLPNGVDMAARAIDRDTGLSIRLVRAYDINQDKLPCRLDVLYGWAVLRPEMACRVSS